ncbi:MAG: serine hydrolase [Candidatus Pacebacteria bacterium]|jgi:D-alanyl-D-alanine carboxypeptidase|nr:serine hydrolase [Candidatus Paceibacterota bacterium]
METLMKKTYLIIALTMVSELLIPKTAAAFSWPEGAALAQIVSALKQEIASAKALAKNAKSATPISATAYVAIDMVTGKVLLQKNPDIAYPIASVTKLMNAVVTLENNDKNKTVAVTDKMLKPEGTSPAIFKGLNITVGKLLQAALIQSTNDAAESLAYSVGKEKFIGLMNQKAKDLKMSKTAYYDASGLDKRNKSTANDLAKLLTYVRAQHPEILETTKKNDFWLPDKEGTLMKFRNMNDFYNYSAFLGGKTGYTPEARQTFASVFDVKSKPVAIVILRSANYQADTFKILKQLNK